MNLKLDLFRMQQCWMQARVFERAIHARFPLEEVLSVYPGFHAPDNNRAVDEMVELARKRVA